MSLPELLALGVLCVVGAAALLFGVVELGKLGRCGLSQDELARRLRGEE